LKFIIDQQLPPLLAKWLTNEGFDAVHARDILSRDAPDVAIWRTACEMDAVMVSKDEDFVSLFITRGGARLVWVRLGNCDNATLIARVQEAWPGIIERLRFGDGLVELR
jgi:predicted nuclease of predicted toxin-antitoxin system